MYDLLERQRPLKKRLTRRSYLDMQELYVLPQLPPQIILLQSGVPPHFCHHVRNHPDREIAGDGLADIDQ
jgi:hypothetical protein